MAEDDTWKEVRKNVLIAVLSAAAIAFLAWIGNLFGVPLWKWALKWLGSKHAWPGWGIAVLFVPWVLMLLIIGTILYFNWTLRQDTQLDETYKFRELRHYELIWRWDFSHDPKRLSMFCPMRDCDMQLTDQDVRPQPDGLHFTCRRCKCEIIVPEERNVATVRETVSLEIDRLRRTGEWKKFMKRQ